MRALRQNLLFKVILAIILGVALGNVLPKFILRIIATFHGLFSELLSFIIPLIILGLIVPSIAKLGNTAGKLLLTTIGIAYSSTLISGFGTYFLSMQIFPSMLANQTATFATLDDSVGIEPYFSLDFPPLFGVMSALIFAFLLGLALSKIPNTILEKVAVDFEKVIVYLIEKLIIPLLPYFIFSIFIDMTNSGQVGSILSVFLKIIGIIFAMHVGLLLFQYIIAGALTKQNPFRLLYGMLPAYFTALGTQSSAATIPVTLREVKKLNVQEHIANFTIPLCATMHLAGSILKIVACVIAIMLINGYEIEFLTMAGFIFMLGIAMVAAPGVPGGAIMAAIGIIAGMLGFGAEDQALMIALYIAMDSFGTACNVTGDGALTIIIDRIFRNSKSFDVANTEL